MTRTRPLLFGIHGPSGSGKTTLIERLVPELRARGLRVGTIKHVTHPPSLDTPGKDSHRHAAAGAACVALMGAGAAAFFVHADEPDDLHGWSHLFDGRVEVVLVEGYRTMPIPAVALDVAAVPAFPDWPAGHLRRPPRWRLVRSQTATWPGLWPQPVVHALAEVIAEASRRREAAASVA
jgi:molybdopterin-guanine dinucleotide biosynthesis adapter protein